MNIRSASLCCLVCIAFHLARARSSADYAITAETTDFGGQRLSSAQYAIDSSVGPLAGVSAQVISGTVARQGYVGQLYEVVGHSLSASDYYPPELGSTQVFAVAALDDGTSLRLPSTGVTFGVLSGPLEGVSPDGTVTIAAVPSATSAQVSASSAVFAGPLEITLHIQDTLPDNFGLYANDTLADAWQVLHFGLENPIAAPGLDPDGDGQNNRFEFLAGLLPTDSASRLQVRLEGVAGHPTQRRIVFSPVFPERSYVVKSKSDLNEPTWMPLTNALSDEGSPERSVTDLSADGSLKFYIIEVAAP